MSPKLAALLTAAAVTLSFATACNPIRQESDVTVADPSSFDRLVFGEYWVAEGISEREESEPLRIAIAECTVELVVERILHSPDRYGSTKREMRYGKKVRRELPGLILQLLEERFENRGHTLVPWDSIRSSQSFFRYRTRKEGASPIVRHDRAVETTAGMVRISELHSSPGMPIIVGRRDEALEIDRALAEELDATVLRVRVRMGAHEGRATMEDGTELLVAGNFGQGSLRSSRTLASEKSVMENHLYTPSLSGVFVIRGDRYLEATKRLFPNYISLATEALD